jgi:hypothetical protein
MPWKTPLLRFRIGMVVWRYYAHLRWKSKEKLARFSKTGEKSPARYPCRAWMQAN